VELTICERWTQYVQPPKEKWFLDYAVRSPQDAGVHLTAGWHCYQLVKELGIEVNSAVEFFGGIGAQSLMIQELFAPANHVVRDFSHEAVAHIKAQVPGVYVHQADSYDPMWQHRADLVGLDFGDLTVWKTRPGEPHRGLLDRVFEEEPKAVVLTDIACRYLHLHRERYDSILGTGASNTYELYLEALAGRLEELYSCRMVGGFYHRWSTVMVLVPRKSRIPSGGFVPTPDTPVGLKVVQ
jgi:hypothetical protein